MEINKTEKYTHIHCTENNIKNFITKLRTSLHELKSEHLMITFSEEFNNNTEGFLLFLEIANQKKIEKTSFVIVHKIENTDDYPEDFNIVPTLTEAKDIIAMEAMERDLGF